MIEQEKVLAMALGSAIATLVTSREPLPELGLSFWGELLIEARNAMPEELSLSFKKCPTAKGLTWYYYTVVIVKQ